jgi:hypothetical protein
MNDAAFATASSKLGIQRIVAGILTVFAARGTPRQFFIV